MILEKLLKDPDRREKKHHKSHKEQFLRDTDVVPKELDQVFNEFGAAWRRAMRQHDRASADKLLQLCLKTIPLRCCGRSACVRSII